MHDSIKIETYWNVNHSANVTFSRRYTIKIETYWNVNPNQPKMIRQLA